MTRFYDFENQCTDKDNKRNCLVFHLQTFLAASLLSPILNASLDIFRLVFIISFEEVGEIILKKK